MLHDIPHQVPKTPKNRKLALLGRKTIFDKIPLKPVLVRLFRPWKHKNIKTGVIIDDFRFFTYLIGISPYAGMGSKIMNIRKKSKIVNNDPSYDVCVFLGPE